MGGESNPDSVRFEDLGQAMAVTVTVTDGSVWMAGLDPEATLRLDPLTREVQARTFPWVMGEDEGEGIGAVGGGAVWGASSPFGPVTGPWPRPSLAST